MPPRAPKFQAGDVVTIRNRDRDMGDFTVDGNVLDAMGRVHVALSVLGDDGFTKGAGCVPQGKLILRSGIRL